jgi:cold shock CspA family protein
MILTVDRYLPHEQYGFFNEEPFIFRLSQFHRLHGDSVDPIPGESVEVFLDDIRVRDVLRLNPPKTYWGDIVMFDVSKGFGYIRSGSNRVFFHASDLQGCWTPSVGQSVRFFEGRRKGKPRACYVASVPSPLEELLGDV